MDKKHTTLMDVPLDDIQIDALERISKSILQHTQDHVATDIALGVVRIINMFRAERTAHQQTRNLLDAILAATDPPTAASLISRLQPIDDPVIHQALVDAGIYGNEES